MKIQLKESISAYRLVRRLMQPLYIIRLLVRNRRAKDIISVVLLALSLALLGMTLFQKVDTAAGTGTENAQISELPVLPAVNAQASMPVSLFGFKPVIVMSGSMEPELMTHSLVLVRRTRNVKPGDIIMFRSGGAWILHRYLADNADGSVITKGDNNPAPDYAPVSRECIYGKVVARANWLAPVLGMLGSLSWKEALCAEHAYAAPLEPVPAYHAEIRSDGKGNLTFTTDEGAGYGPGGTGDPAEAVLPGDVLSHLTPGDSWSYTVTTANRSAQPVSFYLKEAVSEISDTLLFDKLVLEISSDKILYSGPLAGASFAPVTLAPGASRTLTYRYAFPADAGNEYQNRLLQAKFCYISEAAAYDPAETQADPAPDNTPKRRKTAEWTDGRRRSSGNGSGPSGGTAASAGPGIHLYPSPDVKDPVLTDGEWILIDAERHIWNYRVGSELARSGWIAVRNPYSQTDPAGFHWFYFYDDAVMAYGWLRRDADGTYHGNNLLAGQRDGNHFSELLAHTGSAKGPGGGTYTWYFLYDVSDGDLGTLKATWRLTRADLAGGAS